MSKPKNRKVQILWAAPAERRYGSGDVLTEANLEAAGLSVEQLLDAKEAQILDDKAKVTRTLDPLPEPEPEPAAEGNAAA